jgi:hypothetical protein
MVSADHTSSASGWLARARSGARTLLDACADLIVSPCCLVCRRRCRRIICCARPAGAK